MAAKRERTRPSRGPRTAARSSAPTSEQPLEPEATAPKDSAHPITAASHERDAVTLKFDATRVSLHATGELNLGAASVLSAVTDKHIAAHRRYVRLDLSGVSSVDGAAIEVLAEIHSRLLAERGTLILTGVNSWLEIALGEAGGAFLMIAPTAADGA